MQQFFISRLAASTFVSVAASGFLMVSTAVGAATCPFDNGGSDAMNDGVVLTRYALGVTGAPLIASTRYASLDPLQVKGNIECVGCALDMDGNGQIDTVDTTIIARHLAGFTGPSVTNGLGLSASAAANVTSFLANGCAVGGAINAFVQNGNAFGAPAVLGTTDGQPLTVGVGGGNGLRIVPSLVANSPDVINGAAANKVLPVSGNTDVGGNTIAGGGSSDTQACTTTAGPVIFPGSCINSISGARFATISGGGSNNIYASPSSFGINSTIGGGYQNSVSGSSGTVSGGERNSVQGRSGTIAGGVGNTAVQAAAIAGGVLNSAVGTWSSIPGGQSNTAAGETSFAAGNKAKARGDREFVWSGSTTGFDPATQGLWAGDTANTFNVKADKGVYFQAGNATSCTLAAGGSGWNCVSDRNVKDKFVAIDPQAVLAKVAAMPISTWVIKGYNQIHMGPMAQDFRAAFGLGHDDVTINSTDAQGVALAAIQGLHAVVKSKDSEIAKLKARLAAIEKKLGLN